MFFLLGPGTALGHNTIIFMIECQVNYALDCIRKMSEAGRKTMTVKKNILEEYVDWQKSSLDKTVFHSGCFAWYQNSSGFAWALWPRSCIEYWWALYSCKESDFEFTDLLSS